MSEYEKQSPAIRAIIDRRVPDLVAERGLTEAQAREVLAASVRTIPARPTPKGH